MHEAHTAFEQGSFAKAESLLLELLEFASAETRAWKLLAHAQKAMGKIQPAINSANRALELQHSASPRSDVPVSLTLARLLWQQGDTTAARAMLGVLMMRQPDNMDLIELKQQWRMEMPA